MAVERRNVEIGKIYPEGFEVIQGVVAGEKIVTAGISNLQDGMTVRLLK